MNAETILKRIRIFLLGFSIFTFAGSVFELVFLNHTRETLQWTPFILCALGILLAALMLIHPTVQTVRIVRIGMWIVLAGGIFGMGVHVFGNLKPYIEGGRSAGFGQLITTAFGGRNPLLAPGVLSMAAVMALTALYKHPVENR